MCYQPKNDGESEYNIIDIDVKLQIYEIINYRQNCSDGEVYPRE